MTDEPIIATKDRLGSYDAIETAKPGEPLFPIQGGDPFGPPSVKHWAQLARAEGLRLIEAHPEKSAEHARGLKLLGKATDAEQVAWEMESYQKGHVEQEGGRARYSDHAIEVDDSDHDRAVRIARIKGAERLHNLVGMGSGIVDILDALEACPAEVAQVRGAIEVIKEAAVHIEPRRENERS